MKYNKTFVIFVVIILVLCLSACKRGQTVCAPEVGAPKPTIELAEIKKMASNTDTPSDPIMVEIKGKLVEVDKLVDYPLCNDEWNGIVYVNCDTQVATGDWDDMPNPLFFEGCNLNIAPNTIVYVAAHNDAPYYKGCSCHTSEEPVP